MEFDLLIDYSIYDLYSSIAIFLKNLTQNVVEKLVPDPFLKNWNRTYLWINSLKFYTVFLSYAKLRGLSKYVQTKLQTTCFYLILSFFKKTKRGLELVFLSYFLHEFWRIYSINWPGFIVWFSLLWDIGQYLYRNCSLTRLWHHEFWN